MGYYFPVGTFEDEGQASFRNHNSLKGLSEVYIDGHGHESG